MGKKERSLTDAEIRAANKKHDAEIGRQDIKSWKGKNNSVYETAERDTIGTGWSNRLQHQNNWASKSDAAKNSVLRNQIKIKQIKNGK